MVKKKLRFGLLICDTPIPTVREKYGTYLEVFTEFMRKALATITSDVEFTMEGFNVVDGVYPSREDLSGENCLDGLMITGSSASAHEDKPWIKRLISFVSEVITNYPQMRVVGICYGHQIIALATGGSCIRNEKGWEVGTTEVELTEEGKRVFGQDIETLNIIEMHRDYVPEVPPNFELLCSSPVATVQGIVRRYPSDIGPRQAHEIHVLALQGHPEFSPDIVSKLIDAREANGVMDADTVKEGRRRAPLRDDGIGPIGKAVWGVFGVN